MRSSWNMTRGEEELFQTSKTEAMADCIVKNDGGAEEFHAEIDRFFEEKLRALLD